MCILYLALTICYFPSGINFLRLLYALCLYVCGCVLVVQSCPTLCYQMDSSLSGSSVYGILQERILEWVAMPSYRGSPYPGTEPRSPTLLVRTLPEEPPGKPVAPYSYLMCTCFSYIKMRFYLQFSCLNLTVSERTIPSKQQILSFG